MSEKLINTLGKANKRFLLNEFSISVGIKIKNISQIKKFYGLANNNEAWDLLVSEHNETVKRNKKNIKINKAIEKLNAKNANKLKEIIELNKKYLEKKEKAIENRKAKVITRFFKNLKKKYDYKVTGKDIMEYANKYLIKDKKKMYNLNFEKSAPDMLHIWLYFYLHNFFGKYQFNLVYTELSEDDYIEIKKGISSPYFLDLMADEGYYYIDDVPAHILEKIYKKWETYVSEIKSKKYHQFIVDAPRGRKKYENYFKEKHYWDFFVDSGNPRLTRDSIIYIMKGKHVKPEYIQQYFLDSINEHCFLSPILDWANNLFDNVKNKSTKKKYSSIINKINNIWYPTFKNGFDEEHIQKFANDLNINISIEFPFGNRSFKMKNYNSDKIPIRQFKYINTRLNHVDTENDFKIDHNEIVANASSLNKPKELNEEEIEKKFEEVNKSGEFFQFMEFKGQINMIRTAGNIYKLKSEANDIISNFEMENNFSSYTYDFIKDKTLCEFIQKSNHFTCAYQITSEKRNETIKNLDQKQAYTQFKKCPYYMGFLGKITDFRACSSVDFALKNVGLYQISNIKLSSEIDILGMNIFVDGNVYTTPELAFLVKNNCSFSVLCGCWGSTFDFEFSDDMKKKFNGISLYAKWTGQNTSVNEYSSFSMYGKQSFFQNLKYHEPELKICLFDNKAVISYPKNKISYKAHITSFITAYQRLTLLEQLLKMDLSKVIRVVTDGIYYYEHDFEILDTFRDKEFEEKNVFLFSDSSIISNIVNNDEKNDEKNEDDKIYISKIKNDILRLKDDKKNCEDKLKNLKAPQKESFLYGFECKLKYYHDHLKYLEDSNESLREIHKNLLSSKFIITNKINDIVIKINKGDNEINEVKNIISKLENEINEVKSVEINDYRAKRDQIYKQYYFFLNEIHILEECLTNYNFKRNNKIVDGGLMDDIYYFDYINEGDNEVKNIKTFCEVPFLDHHLKMYYKGPGGTGKTHINLIDAGFIRKLYIAPSWKLSTNKKNEYQIDSSVLARMLPDSEERRMMLKNYDVFIFDECSQYTEDDKNKIFKDFEGCKVIFCGDVGFQLPPISGCPMSETGFDLIKEFETVYRFDCPIISELCSYLRKEIKKINEIETISLKEYLTRNITEKIKRQFAEKLIKIEDVKNLFNLNDYILVSKNKCNKHHKFECNCDDKNYAHQYVNLLKDAGEKYICKKNYGNLNNGDITFKQSPACILAYAFSIHSIQGETIKDKIFIDLRNMFEPQMLYTAISRAKKIEQLYFLL